jgi:hypothetical protein
MKIRDRPLGAKVVRTTWLLTQNNVADPVANLGVELSTANWLSKRFYRRKASSVLHRTAIPPRYDGR